MESLTYSDVAVTLEAALSSRQPFSLVRLGDGENSVLQYPERCSEERIQHVMTRALEDRAYLPDEIAAVRHGMIEAVNGSDIVGGYPSWHPKRVCSLFQEDLAYAGVTIERICYPAVHFYLAASGSLARLILLADHVTLITGRDIKARFEERFGRDAEQILLPSERIFRLKGEEGRAAHYPDIYRSILGGLQAKGSGHLFLVGGGILAKAYCHAAKKAGGFAVDIGSVFDYWAGVPTRERKPTVKNGAVLDVDVFRRGLGLDDAPLSDERLRADHPQGFKPITISAEPGAA